LGKGFNYAVSSAVLPIADIVTGLEKVVVSLPVEAAEEIRQETVRILKASGRSTDNLPELRGGLYGPLHTIADLTVLLADKGNATVILNTKDYNEKVSALLSAPTYRSLPKDPTEAIEHKTTLLLKKSSLAEEVAQPLRPQGSRPPRLHGLPNIHKEGVLLRPIVSAIGART
jgi:hypothetical protein